MIDAKPIRDRYAALSPQLDERGRRCFAASEARAARLWRDRGDRASDRDRSQYDWARAQGPGGWVRPAGWADAPSWRRAQAVDGGRHDAQRRLAGAGLAKRARRPDVAAALDVQEPAADHVGTEVAGAPDQSHGRWRTAQARGVQPASQP